MLLGRRVRVPVLRNTGTHNTGTHTRRPEATQELAHGAQWCNTGTRRIEVTQEFATQEFATGAQSVTQELALAPGGQHRNSLLRPVCTTQELTTQELTYQFLCCSSGGAGAPICGILGVPVLFMGAGGTSFVAKTPVLVRGQQHRISPPHECEILCCC